ncbi:hypothetical protein PVAND_000076 [Polypedilum vanderplanki]|uniref:Uncharacterized protein n=1 Tax=Polypedilum vanderplanki TaxID=319348 RepID=A0A9J6BJM8_POLVA|nr:hypothetical protein PVAND_000076 [Polypedilum vanderplanki]
MKILQTSLVLIFGVSLAISKSFINGTLENDDYCTRTFYERPTCENILIYLIDNDKTLIDSEDFEMTEIDRNDLVKGLYFTECSADTFYSCEFENNMKFLPIRISDKFPNLLTIHAQAKSISKIRKNNLEHLSKLGKLDLTYNIIEIIEVGSFDDLVELISLRLSNNKIKNLDENIFKNLVKLEELLLNQNEISVMKPKLFENLRTLKVLDISGNTLVTIHEDLFKNLVNLIRLAMTGCKLESLPEKIFENLQKLKYLHLSENYLTTLAENLFINNQNLVLIYLNYNKIQTLKYKTFENLPNVQVIELKGNECIHANFGEIFSNIPLDDHKKEQLKNELNQKCSNS